MFVVDSTTLFVVDSTTLFVVDSTTLFVVDSTTLFVVGSTTFFPFTCMSKNPGTKTVGTWQSWNKQLKRCFKNIIAFMFTRKMTSMKRIRSKFLRLNLAWHRLAHHLGYHDYHVQYTRCNQTSRNVL